MSYSSEGVLYYLVDMPAGINDSPTNYLAVWLGASAGTDLPGNRFTDRLTLDEQAAPALADGTAGALFALPAD